MVWRLDLGSETDALSLKRAVAGFILIVLLCIHLRVDVDHSHGLIPLIVDIR